MSAMPSKLDLSKLTEKERQAVMTVIQRDSALRTQQERKISYLKTELHILRKRGALRPGIDVNSSCGRCRTELGFLLNSGAVCPLCQKKVCKSCRHVLPDKAWACLVCAKQMELKAVSGEWMTDHEKIFQQGHMLSSGMWNNPSFAHKAPSPALHTR